MLGMEFGSRWTSCLTRKQLWKWPMTSRKLCSIAVKDFLKLTGHLLLVIIRRGVPLDMLQRISSNKPSYALHICLGQSLKQCTYYVLLQGRNTSIELLLLLPWSNTRDSCFVSRSHLSVGAIRSSEPIVSGASVSREEVT